MAQGVPFARDYGGLLANRSFGGALVSRTFYARGQTGQQLLLGCYGAMNRQIEKGQIKVYNRHEVLDVVLIEGKARGVIARDLVTGRIERFGAHAVVLQPEVTVTCSSSRQTPWDVTEVPHGKLTNEVHFSPILVSYKFTRPVFRYTENNKVN